MSENKGFIFIMAFIIMFITFGCITTYKDHLKVEANKLHNQKYVVVKIGSEEGFTNDKFHTPKEYYKLLARSIRDTNMFIEWEVDKVKYYNTNIDDTLRFDFIRKDREFRITR